MRATFVQNSRKVVVERLRPDITEADLRSAVTPLIDPDGVDKIERVDVQPAGGQRSTRAWIWFYEKEDAAIVLNALGNDTDVAFPGLSVEGGTIHARYYGERLPFTPEEILEALRPEAIRALANDPTFKGPPGLQGTTGPTGPQGEKGEVGPTGPQGPIGPQGERGPEGPRGEPGPATGNGPASMRGERGEQGPEGPKGNPGPRGPKGTKGDPGTPGAPGPKGDPGTPGVKGDKGDAGAKGDPGIPGAKGDPGTAGAPGTKGDPGDPGKSAPKESWITALAVAIIALIAVVLHSTCGSKSAPSREEVAATLKVDPSFVTATKGKDGEKGEDGKSAVAPTAAEVASTLKADAEFAKSVAATAKPAEPPTPTPTPPPAAAAPTPEPTATPASASRQQETSRPPSNPRTFVNREGAYDIEYALDEATGALRELRRSVIRLRERRSRQ